MNAAKHSSAARSLALRLLRGAACLLLALLTALVVTTSFAPAAEAAFAPRILVIYDRSVPASLRREAISVLSDVGDIVPEQSYFAAAREQGVAPTSDEAVMLLAPQQYVTMVVVLEKDRAGLVATFRDGYSGDVVNSVQVHTHGKHLPAASRVELAQGAHDAIAHLRGAAAMRGGRPAAPRRAPPRPSPFTRPAPEAEPAPQAEPLAEQEAAPEPEPEAEEPSTEEPWPAEGEVLPEEEEEEGMPLPVELSCGVGLGTREVSLPSSAASRELSTGLFPAVSIALLAQAELSDHFAFAVRGSYQTSLGLTASQTPPAGATRETSLRSHHVDFGVQPSYRFKKSKSAVSVGLFAGWAVRGLRSVIALNLPAYTLHGPVVRPELVLPFGSEAVVLRLAPELLLLSLSEDLRNAGNISGMAIGIGGEATLSVQAKDWLRLSLSYRESHASAGTPWIDTFQDVERFAVLQGVLQY